MFSFRRNEDDATPPIIRDIFDILFLSPFVSRGTVSAPFNTATFLSSFF